jgi:hypothetical protein
MYKRIPAHDTKIVIGDFNAKMERKEIFKPLVKKLRMHEPSNMNRIRAIDFATQYFPHKNVHKKTWQSPDGRTNEFDRVLVDGRHTSSIMAVGSCRGADCGWDRHLVRIKYRQMIPNTKIHTVQDKGIETLKS